MTNYPVIDELLPCPFCGHDSIILTKSGYVDDDGNDQFQYQVHCDPCQIYTVPENSKQLVLDTWNTRAPAGEQPVTKDILKNLGRHTWQDIVAITEQPEQGDISKNPDNLNTPGQRVQSVNTSARDGPSGGTDQFREATKKVTARDGREVDEVYPIEDWKNDLVRIDFRNHDIKDIGLLRGLCAAVQPERDTPAYSFGDCYYCKDGVWFEGASHNLIGNKFQVVKVHQITKATLPTAAATPADETKLRSAISEAIRAPNNGLYSHGELQQIDAIMEIMRPYLAAAGADKEDGGAK